MTTTKNHTSRGANSAPDAQAAVRRRDAMELRRLGATYTQIAEHVGVSRSTAYGYVKRELDALADQCRESAEHLRDIELERLDAGVQSVARVMHNDNASDDTRLRAVAQWIRLSESRRKLLGIDAPEKQEQVVELRFADAGREVDAEAFANEVKREMGNKHAD